MHITDMLTICKPGRALAKFIAKVLSNDVFLLQIPLAQSFRDCRERCGPLSGFLRTCPPRLCSQGWECQ